MEFRIFSKAFKDGTLIPDLYSHTRRGKNISPPLHWENPPGQTKCFAIIVEDVDAPIIAPISHWILYDIPSEKRELQEGVPPQGSFPEGTIQGKNYFRRSAYIGPSPPFGTHRDAFKIFTLDEEMGMDLKMTRKKLLKAMGPHIVGQARLMGLFSKNRQFKERDASWSASSKRNTE